MKENKPDCNKIVTSDQQTKATGNGMYLNLKPGLDHPFEPRSAGSISRDFTICLSLQCKASSRDLLNKSQSPAIPRLAKCRKISIFAMPVAFTGKYRELMANNGKY